MDARGSLEAIRAFGLDPAGIAEGGDRTAKMRGLSGVSHRAGSGAGELNLPLGVVDAIVGQSRRRWTSKARPTMPAPLPWICGAMRWPGPPNGSAVEREDGGEDRAWWPRWDALDVQPGAANVIPGRGRGPVWTCGTRMRRSSRTRDRAFAAERRRDRRPPRPRGQRGSSGWISRRSRWTAAMTGVLARAVEAAGYRSIGMTSGAGHDAMILAAMVPAAMLFLRSPGGISHHPDESVLRGRRRGGARGGPAVPGRTGGTCA